MTDTELLLKISESQGIITTKFENMERQVTELKETMHEIKSDIREHEKLHADLASRQDVNNLGEKVRKIESDLSNRVKVLEDAPAKAAQEREKKIKDQLLSIVVGIVGIAGISVIIYAIADNIIKNAK